MDSLIYFPMPRSFVGFPRKMFRIKNYSEKGHVKSKFKNFTTQLSSKIVTKRIINLGKLNDYMDLGHSEVSKIPLVYEILPTQTLDTVIS